METPPCTRSDRTLPRGAIALFALLLSLLALSVPQPTHAGTLAQDDPEPSCVERCEEHAREVREDCLDDGRAPEACAQKARRAFAECMERCDPPLCPERCERAFKEALAACDEAADPDACRREARQQFHECREECPREEPAPSECVRDCREALKEALDGCVDADDPDACRKDAHERFEHCMEECPRREPDPRPEPGEPGPERCKQACERAYKEALAQCDGADDPNACRREAREQFADCRDECPREEPAPSECVRDCREALKEALDGCVDADDPDACRKDAHERFEHCMEECPRREPDPRPEPGEPGPERCKQACERAYKEALAHCDGADDPNACRREAREQFADCRDECPREEPAPSECVRDCREALKEALDKCHGAEQPDACRKDAHERFEHCMEECPRREPDPRPAPPERSPECEADCARKAAASFVTCFQETGDVEVCRQRMERQLETCLQGCRRPAEIAPGRRCGVVCSQAAREVLERCLAEGGDEEGCRERAEAKRDSCMRTCSGKDETSCEGRCQEMAAVAKRRCLRSGRDEATCAEHAERVLERCLDRCERAALTRPTP